MHAALSTPSPVVPFALFLLLSFDAGPAAAAKLLVATHGTDSVACGPSGAPCRSISQAIANAAAGDTIVVGPGRYGDANADGSFDDPGDEAAQIDSGCDCLVHVPADKPLFLLSRDGATTTLVDAAGAPIRVVKIDAPGTTFGKPKRGFTLTGSGDTIGFDSSAADLHVAGNIALANPSHGFRVQGDRCDTHANQALHNGSSGFFLDGARDGVTRSNLAVGNQEDGFSQVNPSLVQKNVSIGNVGDGFDQQGDDVVYRGNAALGNGEFGFDLNSGDRTLLTGNLANSNRNGVHVEGSDTVLTRNSIVGNLGVGVVVEAGGTPLTIAESNLVGNNASPDPAVTNCAVTSLAPGPLSVATNFWGAATGPGADPADELCLLVPQTGLVSDPPALLEIRVKPPR
jgi:parallel beta-helix repeat protein